MTKVEFQDHEKWKDQIWDARDSFFLMSILLAVEVYNWSWNRLLLWFIKTYLMIAFGFWFCTTAFISWEAYVGLSVVMEAKFF